MSLGSDNFIKIRPFNDESVEWPSLSCSWMLRKLSLLDCLNLSGPMNLRKLITERAWPQEASSTSRSEGKVTIHP